VILIDALAAVLLELDVTPVCLSEIARTSFVKAGALVARKKHSNRPHIARVAALTGLSRNEVRRIVNANYTLGAKCFQNLPRSLQVIAGWKATPKYAGKGKSRMLRMTGAAPSFQSLCKEFSGDIPHKAIATELVSRDLIRLRKIGKEICVYLVRSTARRQKKPHGTLSYIAALLQSIASPDRVLVRRKQRIYSPDQLSSAYFQNSIASRVASFVDELPIEPKTRRKQRRRKDALDVFAVVSRNSN
jgi:hypothetical protein